MILIFASSGALVMQRGLNPAFSWATIGTITVIVGCLANGDTNDSTNPGTVNIGVSDVLADAGPMVVLPALDAFIVEATALETALSDWDASGGQDEPLAAQAQFASTMIAWQQLELMQIGPAGSSLSAIAGEDLRDEIYSWPTINACRVDQETVEEDWDSTDFFEANLVNSYGMDALEYILWASDDNDCPNQVDINDDGSWDALGDGGVAENRAAFAHTLTGHIRAQGEALRDVWSADGGNFSGKLALTDGSSPYASEQEALNAMFHAMFYLETSTKDRKLAYPLGEQDCSTENCAEEVEHLYSGLGTAAVEANLLGFQALFTGGDGAGFDDLLAEIGHGDLADQILADLDTAIALAGTMEAPLDEAIEATPADVQALYDAVKAVTDALKGDLATVMVLEIPAEASGDND